MTSVRFLKWAGIAIGGIIALPIVIFVFTFSSDSRREIDRVSNPSNTVDAVVEVVDSGGAIGTSMTTIVAVPKGKPTSAARSFFGENVERFYIHYPLKLNLSWRDDQSLTIHVVCEEIPRAAETSSLLVERQKIFVNIEYDRCPRSVN